MTSSTFTFDPHLATDMNHPSLFDCLTLSVLPIQPVLADTAQLTLPQVQTLCPKALHAVIHLIVLFEQHHGTHLLYQKIQSHPKLKKISHTPLTLQTQKQIRKTGNTLLKEMMPNHAPYVIKQFLDTANTQTAKATGLLEMCMVITLTFLTKVIEHVGLDERQFSIWLHSQPLPDSTLDNEPSRQLDNQTLNNQTLNGKTTANTQRRDNSTPDEIYASTSLLVFNRALMVQKIETLCRQPAITQTSTFEETVQPFATDKKTDAERVEGMASECCRLLKDNPFWLLFPLQNQDKSLFTRLPFAELPLAQGSGKSQTTRHIDGANPTSKTIAQTATSTQTTGTDDFDIIYDDDTNTILKKPMTFWLAILSVMVCLGSIGLIYTLQNREHELPALPDIEDLPNDAPANNTPNTSPKDVAIVRVEDSE